MSVRSGLRSDVECQTCILRWENVESGWAGSFRGIPGTANVIFRTEVNLIRNFETLFPTDRWLSKFKTRKLFLLTEEWSFSKVPLKTV
ncbi:hypothetical protein JTE90_015627 [Oedothorax gibbosus]|uniref:Uncharacterized protein n=1 Tax=Oedothorax gibbosus TaxID=931172 RepID=A0AAV6UV87_9ARAC|nr:hypothetical protein JTE90_015627 [Oedothorax gibbosus]